MISESEIQMVLEHILQREGGLVYDKADRGGLTNFGITNEVAKKVLGKSADKITVDEAKAIYREHYLKPFMWVDGIEEFELLVDMAVNHGVGGAAKMLQEALNIKIDGVMGDKTKEAALSTDFYTTLLQIRLMKYVNIVVNDHSQLKFLRGWVRTRILPFMT